MYKKQIPKGKVKSIITQGIQVNKNTAYYIDRGGLIYFNNEVY